MFRFWQPDHSPCHAGAGRVRSVGRVETADLTWVKALKIYGGPESRPKSRKRPKSMRGVTSIERSSPVGLNIHIYLQTHIFILIQ